jgi:hypothetical protein
VSERTEVEVLVPLNRAPADEAERRQIVRDAFKSAGDLVRPGRVLGLVSVARAEHHLTGSPALKIRFAVEAPESIQPQRRTTVTR